MKQTSDITDLRDSRLLYRRNLPVFGYIIVLAVALLLCGAAVWASNTSKVDIVRSQGNVQSADKNYVMSPYAGEILDINGGEAGQ